MATGREARRPWQAAARGAGFYEPASHARQLFLAAGAAPFHNDREPAEDRATPQQPGVGACAAGPASRSAPSRRSRSASSPCRCTPAPNSRRPKRTGFGSASRCSAMRSSRTCRSTWWCSRRRVRASRRSRSASSTGVASWCFPCAEHRLAEATLEAIAPELLGAVVEAMTAHELGHCWRYVHGAWHSLPAGFAEPREADDARTAQLRREMRETRREEGYADLVGLAWTARQHPAQYARVHAWLSGCAKASRSPAATTTPACGYSWRAGRTPSPARRRRSSRRTCCGSAGCRTMTCSGRASRATPSRKPSLTRAPHPPSMAPSQSARAPTYRPAR